MTALLVQLFIANPIFFCVGRFLSLFVKCHSDNYPVVLPVNYPCDKFISEFFRILLTDRLHKCIVVNN